jgi:predicted ATPase with chaperone activity
MVARVSTVAFQGIEGVPVEVQVMVAPGKIITQIVGLPDKAVAESRERVHAALHASGLALPAKRITVNLAPADLPKEGSRKPHSQTYLWQIDEALQNVTVKIFTNTDILNRAWTRHEADRPRIPLPQ